jgi:hypothetical protein
MKNKSISKKRGISEDPEDKSEEKSNESSKDAPNIFFNLRPPKRRVELYAIAAFAVVLQLGVLLFSGFITYYAKSAFLKGSEPVSGYA